MSKVYTYKRPAQRVKTITKDRSWVQEDDSALDCSVPTDTGQNIETGLFL